MFDLLTGTRYFPDKASKFCVSVAHMHLAYISLCKPSISMTHNLLCSTTLMYIVVEQHIFMIYIYIYMCIHDIYLFIVNI